jgi:hypothetical protein
MMGSARSFIAHLAMEESDADVAAGLLFYGEKYPETELTRPRSVSVLAITPIRRKWTFRILAGFQNERSHQWVVGELTRLDTNSEFGMCYTFVCDRSGLLPKPISMSSCSPIS